jgi:putative ABC transport system ATP-binding protein
MLKWTDISYAYPNSAEISFPNAAIEKGTENLIIGPSGCGKSTLMNIIAGLIQPDKGSVVLDNEDIYSLGLAQRDKFRGQKMGIIFQSSHFMQSLTLKENMRLSQKLGKAQKGHAEIDRVLEMVGLEKHMKKKLSEMSVGEQQRASIARAVLSEPSVILADEPTSALDDQNCIAVLNLLRSVAQEYNSSLLIITHDQRLKGEVESKIELS